MYCSWRLALLLISALCALPCHWACQNGLLYPAETPDGYFYCAQGELQPGSCPTGSYFDVSFMMCRHGVRPTPTEDANGGSSQSSGICQRWGLAADLSDCNRFYHCADKGATLQHLSCGQGQIFNELKFSCTPGDC
ncbi:hypothetical protein KR222_001072 [Zaprionus bogoriensis]|nr:hypothetical protein KR222_001072 [Zaprionus bogoriensis]